MTEPSMNDCGKRTMRETVSPGPDRRRFLSRVSAGMLTFGCTGILLSARFPENRPGHKFQRSIPPATYLEWARHRHQKYIGILKQLQQEIGEFRLLECLKRASYADNVALGKRLSSRIDSMKTFAGPFRDEDSRVGRTIVREIIEDTDTVFEMKVTECLTEKVFREADATDLGYACVCHADFGLPAGMDIHIELIRENTLMQGHGCCDHRYVWTR